MKAEDLFCKFDALDPALLEESEQYGGRTMQKNNWRKTAIAAGAAAAILVAVPNVSAGAAQALGDIPVLGRIVEAVTFRTYSAEEEHRRIDLEVPQVSVEGSGAGEAISADIAAIAEQMLADYQAAAEAEGRTSLSLSYDVLATDERCFTLRLNCFQAQGGGREWNEFYTVDRATGERLALADLFLPDADYVTAVSDDLRRQMEEQMAADQAVTYFLDDTVPGAFRQIAPDQNFYLNADGDLVIAFDEYEVAPGFMGAVEFTVTPEAIADLLV